MKLHPTQLAFSVAAALIVGSAGCAVPSAEQTVDAGMEDTAERVGNPIRYTPPERVEFENEGEMCLFEAGPHETFLALGGEQTFVAGDRLRVRVAVPHCLSASCDVNRVARCDVMAKGNVLMIESYLSYDVVDAEQCTLDCGLLWAFCESEPLDAGHYEIVHGSATRPLTVPSVISACGPAPCSEDEDCPNGFCERATATCSPSI